MSVQPREFNIADGFINMIDTGLRTLLNNPAVTGRANPADSHDDIEMDDAQKKHIAGLMRINHCGEVCAQGLYQGQALTAKLPEVREKMEESAAEENDHLAWTAGRVEEMGGKLSILNPIFYVGSVAIGAAAGLAGDKWSLGFVAETEYQVVKHLDGHLEQIPEQDKKSRSILKLMKDDELNHATKAIEHGAEDLPAGIKHLMNLTSKLMTRTTYHI